MFTFIPYWIKKYNLQFNLVSKMSFKRLQWTAVHISFCFQMSWIQGEVIPDAYQEKISTVWASCAKQYLNLTWILVLLACSKIEFFLKKGCFFNTDCFSVSQQCFYCESFFRFRRNLIWYRKKSPELADHRMLVHDRWNTGSSPWPDFALLQVNA